MPITDAVEPLPLTENQLQTMTVAQVWRHYSSNVIGFRKLLNEQIVRLAAIRGYSAAGDQTVERFLRDGHDKPFLSAVEAVVQSRHIPAENFASYNASRTHCKDTRSFCYAPATSLSFARDGSASVCCYTRQFPVGRYPDQTLEEIWFGLTRLQFRDEMGRASLPAACYKCGDQLRAGNHRGLLASTFDRFALSPNEFRLDQIKRWLGLSPQEAFPVSFGFALSNKCNLECSMCFGACSSSIRANRENLPALPQVYDAAFVQQLRPFIPHLKRVTFVGGEPFLIDLYYEIWELFIELNPKCEICITTNGTVFTAKVQRILQKLNCRITVSVDSIDKATYEYVRKNATLESTLANVAKFKQINDQKRQTMTINTCPMISTWRHIPGLVAWANANGLTVFFNTVFSPKSESLMHLPAPEQAAIVEHLRQGIQKPTSDVENRNFRSLADLCRQIESWMTGNDAHESPQIVEIIAPAQ